MNLQICFMNETNSDTESPSSDSENTAANNTKQPKRQPKNPISKEEEKTVPVPARPATLSLGQPLLQPITEPMTEVDFFARQARNSLIIFYLDLFSSAGKIADGGSNGTGPSQRDGKDADGGE